MASSLFIVSLLSIAFKVRIHVPSTFLSSSLMLLDHDLLHIHKLLANGRQPYIIRPVRLSKHAEPISIHSFHSENSTAQFGDIYSCHPVYCFYKRVCVCVRVRACLRAYTLVHLCVLGVKCGTIVAVDWLIYALTRLAALVVANVPSRTLPVFI